MDLPTEIRLDIAEYTQIPRLPDRYSNIGVSDLELIYRIRRYEPTFDYNKWRELLKEKRALQEAYYPRPTRIVSDILREYSIPIRFDPIHIRFIKNEDITRYHQELISEIAYATQTDRKSYFILEAFEMPILGTHGRLPEYNDFPAIDEYIHPYQKLIYVGDELVFFSDPCMADHFYGNNIRPVSKSPKLATLPDTLEEYLSFVVSREQQRKKILASKLYPLYEALIGQPYNIQYYFDGYRLPLRIGIMDDRGITLDRLLSLLPSDIRNKVKETGEGFYSPINYIAFDIGEKSKEVFDELFEIHKFFFPLVDQECNFKVG